MQENEFLAASDKPSPGEAKAPAAARGAAGRAPGRASLAIAVLVFCCVLWGWSFPTMQYASRAFDAHVIGHAHPAAVESLASRALLNGLRFMLAGALYALLTLKWQRGFSRPDVKGGLTVGLCLGGGMLLQVLGLAWARPSVSGFLTSMTVVFAPIAQALILRRAVGGAIWTGVGLALAGATLLAWPNPAAGQGGLTLQPPVPFLGETLTLMGALVFTVQILTLDHFGQAADSRRLTSIMLLTCGVLNLAIAAAVSGGRVLQPEILAALTRDHSVWWSMGSLILFCSVIAIPLMNQYQPQVSPATASVVYCSEPLFALMFSVLLGTEQLTALTLMGGAAVMTAVLVVALKNR